MPDDIFYPKGATVTCVMVWEFFCTHDTQSRNIVSILQG